MNGGRIYSKIITIFTIIFLASSSLLPLTTTAQSSGSQDLANAAVAVIGCTGIESKASNAIQSLLGITSGSQSIPVADEAQENTTNCLNGIAYAAAKSVLAQLTQKTVNWINTGFKGNPLFVQDPGSYFQSIANEQVTNLTNLIGFDPNDYPFGRDVAQSLVSQTQSTFSQNAQYSLGQALADGNTPQDFSNDFNTGGWGAWFSSTLEQQNNPIGFQLMTEDELGNLTDSPNSPVQEAKDEVQRNSGFLDQKQCVSPSTYSQTNADQLVAKAENDLVNNPEADIASDEQTIVQQTCTQWRTSTPGEIIADQANITLGSSVNQLELANQVNESLASVFDALTNQLFNQGLSSLESATGNNSGTQVSDNSGGPGDNSLANQSSSNQSSDNWFGYDASQTNLLDDIPGLVTIQQEFMGQPSTSTDPTINPVPGFGGLPEMIATVNKLIYDIQLLDYCIPGPRPTWQTDVQQEIQSAISQYDGQVDNSAANTAAKVIGVIPVIGGIASGAANTITENEKADFASTLLNAFNEYSARINGTPYYDQLDPSNDSPDDSSGTLVQFPVPGFRIYNLPNGSDSTLVEFQVPGYVPNYLPDVTSEAYTEYGKIQSLQAAVSDYTQEITGFQSVINKLQFLYSQEQQAQATKDTGQQQIDTDTFNSLASAIGTSTGLQQAAGDEALYQNEDNYVVGLLKSCSDQINNSTFTAGLAARGLDNWMPYPGIIQYNDTLTKGVTDPTQPANTWTLAPGAIPNPADPTNSWLPYPGANIVLPFPKMKFANFGSGVSSNASSATCGSNSSNYCWFTFVPALKDSAGGYEPVFMIAKYGQSIDESTWNLKDWFAEFEERLNIY